MLYFKHTELVFSSRKNEAYIARHNPIAALMLYGDASAVDIYVERVSSEGVDASNKIPVLGQIQDRLRRRRTRVPKGL